MIDTKRKLADYILRRLGSPVIKINISNEQLNDCINDAIVLFNDFADDSFKNGLFSIEVTQDVLDNKYFILPSDVYSVDKVFTTTNSLYGGKDPLSLMNQIKIPLTLSALGMNESYQGAEFLLSNYTSNRQRINDFEAQINWYTAWDFNRYNHQLRLKETMSTYSIGDLIGVQCKVNLLQETDLIDDDVICEVYSNNILRKLAIAYTKGQWADNLSKFGGIKLPGGIEFNHQDIKADSDKLLEEAKRELNENYQPFITSIFIA